MMSNGSNVLNGHTVQIDSDAHVLKAMEGAHEFPGFYPIVAIARTGLEFESLLFAWLAAEQGDDPFEVDARSSRKGTYVSYKIRVFVNDARAALRRKTDLATLEGVILLL